MSRADYILFKRAFRLNHPVNPREVGRVLSNLPAITPTLIVETARDRKSPLHKYFEWDDSKAAHEYRLTQARFLVVSIGIETQDGEREQAFVSVVVDDTHQYMDIRKVAQNQELTEQALDAALRELKYWQAKYERYSSYFGPIFNAISNLEQRKKDGKESKGENRSGGKGRKASDTANKKTNRKRDDSRRVSAAR